MSDGKTTWVERTVALAAVVVAISAVVVAVRANGIATRQNEISERTAAPFLTANALSKRAGTTITQEVRIGNVGAPARVVAVNPFTVLRSQLTNLTGQSEHEEILDHYLYVVRKTGAPSGTLATISGAVDNERDFDRLEASARRLAARRNQTFLINLDIYVEIEYLDQFGHRFEEVFLVDPVDGGSLVTGAERERVLDLMEKASRKQVESFESVSARGLFRSASARLK
ncbi:hypothetical protein AB0L40_17015 [Patulibacter sp. NPDC049589]|uniref:hypothetical protein n=1 Tax=Patulibacter sp. NPDC049589 TaxID=3154731 RepID=UPI0034240C98